MALTTNQRTNLRHHHHHHQVMAGLLLKVRTARPNIDLMKGRYEVARASFLSHLRQHHQEVHIHHKMSLVELIDLHNKEHNL